jgi:hypothetical protein
MRETIAPCEPSFTLFIVMLELDDCTRLRDTFLACSQPDLPPCVDSGGVLDSLGSAKRWPWFLFLLPGLARPAVWDTARMGKRETPMDAQDFRRIALSFDGAEESSHMGKPDFRVDGRIFATLASADQGYGNLMLTLEQQAAFLTELPEVFLPIAGGWGRMGMTHIRLAVASEDVLAGALRTAWKLRLEKNARSSRKDRKSSKRTRTAKTHR